MDRITLDNIICGKVRINDTVLVEYVASLPGKIVVVTSNPYKWAPISFSNPSIIFMDGSGEKVRGYRARSVFILSDSNLNDEEINDIAAGLISVSSSAFTTTPPHEVRFIWNIK